MKKVLIRRYSGARKRNIDAKQNKQIKKLKVAVKSIKKTEEKKYLDTVRSLTISSTASSTDLNNLPVWNGANSSRHEQREGTSVVMTRFLMKGVVEIANSGLSIDVDNRVRIMVVFTPDTSTSTSMTEFMESQSLDSYKKIVPIAPYKVLYDKVFNLQQYKALQGTPYPGGNTERRRIPVHINLGKKEFGKTGTKCLWLNSDLTARPPRQGALTLWLLSDSGVITHPRFVGESRLRFRDN